MRRAPCLDRPETLGDRLSLVDLEKQSETVVPVNDNYMLSGTWSGDGATFIGTAPLQELDRWMPGKPPQRIASWAEHGAELDPGGARVASQVGTYYLAVGPPAAAAPTWTVNLPTSLIP